jgi:hypothetical protein
MNMSKFILVTSFLFLKLLPQKAGAQGVNIAKEFKGSPFDNVGELATVLIANAYVIAGIICLVMVILAGLSYVFNAGGKNPQKIQGAWQSLLWSLIGFLTIIASYWIIQILETLTGFQIL